MRSNEIDNWKFCNFSVNMVLTFSSKFVKFDVTKTIKYGTPCGVRCYVVYFLSHNCYLGNITLVLCAGPLDGKPNMSTDVPTSCSGSRAATGPTQAGRAVLIYAT